MRIRSLVPVAILIVVGLLPAFVAAQNTAITSIYTDLSSRTNCRIVENAEVTLVKRCHGTAGYDLFAGFYDERFNVTVISPMKKEFDQNYQGVISPTFSDPGGKAEWRVRRSGGKLVPFALIVRVMVQENADTSPVETSYMAVSKITSRGACVTDKILPGPDQNLRARIAADSSANKPCLE